MGALTEARGGPFFFQTLLPPDLGLQIVERGARAFKRPANQLTIQSSNQPNNQPANNQPANGLVRTQPWKGHT